MNIRNLLRATAYWLRRPRPAYFGPRFDGITPVGDSQIFIQHPEDLVGTYVNGHPGNCSPTSGIIIATHGIQISGDADVLQRLAELALERAAHCDRVAPIFVRGEHPTAEELGMPTEIYRLGGKDRS